MMGIKRKYFSEPEKRQVRQFATILGKFLAGEPYILAELKSAIDKVKAHRKEGKESGLKLTDSNVELILKI
jgi:hypothetical protein